MPKFLDPLYRLYSSWPWFYKNLCELLSVGQWEKWQNKIFDDISGKKILEIGVGPGQLLIRMVKKGYKPTGIEISPHMAHEARTTVKKAGLDIDIIHASVYKMPFEDSSFDSIVMTFVMGEIDDLVKAIREMKRVLKKGGRIVSISGGFPQDNNKIAKAILYIANNQTSLKLNRNNVELLENQGFNVKRTDFGPFNIIHKIVAVKK